MENLPFSIAIRYNGKMEICLGQEVYNPVQILFYIKFPDGYKNTFIAIDSDDDDNDSWAEETLGITQLSKDAGKALEEYLTNRSNYIEPLNLPMNNATYIIVPKEGKSAMYYEVFENGKFFTQLAFDDDGLWQGTNNAAEDIVKSIGRELEKIHE